MAEEILDKVRDVVDGQIDFRGQRRAEFFATALLAISGLIAFNVGYLSEDIRLALYTGLGGTILTTLLVVPPWPIYNRHPVKWLPAGAGLGLGSN